MPIIISVEKVAVQQILTAKEVDMQVEMFNKHLQIERLAMQSPMQTGKWLIKGQ